MYRGDHLRKIEEQVLIVLASGETARWPVSGRFPTPWTGFRVENRSANYVYMALDRTLRDTVGYWIGEQGGNGGILDIDDVPVREKMTFRCASAATVLLTGYAALDETTVGPESVEALPEVRIAEDALVRDPEFNFGAEFDGATEPPPRRLPYRPRPWHRKKNR